MSESNNVAEQAAEVAAAAQAERYVPLPPATQRRLAGLGAVEQAARQRTVDALMTALEALGVEGQVLGYDPQTGMVRLAG